MKFFEHHLSNLDVSLKVFFNRLLEKVQLIFKSPNTMSRTIRFSFVNIPIESSFAVFDKGKKETIDFRKIAPGDTSFEFEIPSDWITPFRTLRTTKYWIPNSFLRIEEREESIEFTGGDYYVDVDRKVLNEELNQRSVETLIHKIHGNANMDGRQQFYISLLALQSYFEHLAYGMLVLSSHCTISAFNGFRNHEARTLEAFSSSNTEFFTDTIAICPGKENLGSIMLDDLKREVENIFNEIRTLRNKVVHKWGYKDISREELREVFLRVNENLDINGDDNDFYQRATFVFIRLYAKASHIKNQLSLFNEKFVVSKDREERGYTD